MAAIERRCFSLPWSASQCANALAQKNFAAFGLWRPAGLFAYISLYHAGGELEILNLAVDPDMRRQGHGANLLALVLQAANKMGMQKAVLEVRRSNFAAIALYGKNGFRQVGIRTGYYPDNGEDALIFSRDLDSCILMATKE